MLQSIDTGCLLNTQSKAQGGLQAFFRLGCRAHSLQAEGWDLSC